MAVLERAKALLEKRVYTNCSYYYDNCYYNSPWNVYGRWILLAALVIGAFLIFFLFSCLTARRRRRAGMQPFRGTGWAAGRPPPGWGQQQYAGAPAQQPYGNNFQHPPPPQYTAENQGFYGKPADETNGQAPYGQAPYGQAPYGQAPYGGQQNGVELQAPQNAYQPQRGGEAVYSPPVGPPPAKADGVIR